jgi:REP element-mobilizing transposase RayT
MGNHFHLVLETPQTTLVSGMKWFLSAYTQRFNARHRVRGSLFPDATNPFWWMD